MPTTAQGLIPALVLGPLLALGAGSAQALCVSGLCSCSTTTTNVTFGSYNPLAFGNLDTTGSVKVACTSVAGLLIPFTIDLGKGNNNNYADRRMSFGGYQLSYNLYTDNTYTKIWGDTTSSTLNVGGSVLLDVLALSLAQTFYIYGRLPGRQLTAMPGTYTDSLSVTLTYY